jgi:hypothetical protein
MCKHSLETSLNRQEETTEKLLLLIGKLHRVPVGLKPMTSLGIKTEKLIKKQKEKGTKETATIFARHTLPMTSSVFQFTVV